MFTKSTGAQHPDIIADPLIMCEQDLFKNPAKFVLAIMSYLWRSGAVLDHSNWGGQTGATCAFRGHTFKIHLNLLKYYSFSNFSPCHVSLQSLEVIYNNFN